MRRIVSVMMWTVAGLVMVLGAATAVTAEVSAEGGAVPEATPRAPQEVAPPEDVLGEPVPLEASPAAGSCGQTAVVGAESSEPEPQAGFAPCNCNTVADCNAICPGVPAGCVQSICLSSEYRGRCVFAASCP